MADSPKRNAPRQLAQEGLRVAGKAEQFACPLRLSRGLPKNDSGLGVRKEPLGQPLLLRTVLASCFEVGKPVHDGDIGYSIGTGKLESRLQPTCCRETAEERPRLVEDHEGLVADPIASVLWSQERAQTISKPRAGEA
jgi:hypothetical protein